MSAEYWAHSLEGRPSSQWHSLRAHLEAVAALAAQFAAAFGSPEWGQLAGLWHDLGKHSRAFQDYIGAAGGEAAHLEGEANRTDHSSAGAQHVQQHLASTNTVAGRILAYCIAGHHAGLADWYTQSDGSLARRLAHVRPESRDALARAPADLLGHPVPAMPSLRADATAAGRAFQAALYTRMLFSCLVDADFLDTERFMAPDRASERQRNAVPLEALEETLQCYLDELQAASQATFVNQRRREVLKACRAAAQHRPGLYSLTVPTGGGKTFSSLAFALKHAKTHGLERVVYAVPFTSIIEQNADVFRTALGKLSNTAVLEHHSNLDPCNETPWNRLASENWDAPLVVTTNVQLLESLFASRVSRCRKLHNLVGSVIVLDEAQAIPVEYLAPCLSVLRELVRNYRCTVLLCTATQPAIHRRDAFPIGLEGVREIISDPRNLYTQMKRVQVEYVGALPDDDLVKQLQARPQVLCVVNTKRHAATLFTRLPPDGSAFHLSALMCPDHRSVVIRLIKRRLRKGLACRVVSTQLIEAGVDIDFPVVYRATAGLDSVAQAAGRCNREGRHPIGHAYVFDAEQPPPPGHLRQTAETANELVGLYDDLLSLEAIERYFELSFWKRQDAWDRHGVLKCFALSPMGEPICDFRRAEEAFRLIRDDTEPVIVPWKWRGQALVDRLRERPLPDRATRRALQRYTVGVHPWQRNRLITDGSIEIVHEQYPVLIDRSRYRNDIGLVLDGDGTRDPEDLMV